MYKKTLKLPKDVTFGIEIEFESASYDWVEYYLHEWNKEKNYVLDKRFLIYEEMTVIDKVRDERFGGEVISPILKDNIQTWKDIREVCILLSNLDAKCGEKTGAHIHFGSQILGDNPINWVNLIKLWTIYEDDIYKFSSGYSEKIRSGVFEYAKPLKEKFLKILTDFNIDSIENLNAFLFLFNIERKTGGIDFTNVMFGQFYKNNTIEIRCPNGTVDYEIWQNNINFFAHFLLYCRDLKFDTEFIDAVLQGKVKTNVEDLLDMIYSGKQDKKDFMKQYLKKV